MALANGARRVAVQSAQRDVDRRVKSARDPLFAGSRAEAITAQAEIARDDARSAAEAARTRLAAYWGAGPNYSLDVKDFFDVAKFPTLTFKSTSVTVNADKSALLKGDLTLKGVTKNIEIPVTAIGGGKDPWGGYRQGFEGRTTIKLKDFGIDYDLGPASQEAEVMLSIEGIRQ